MIRWLIALALLLALSPLGGCAAGRAFIRGEDVAAVSRGYNFAQARCAACHAVTGPGPSPRADAPPFRELVNRYPPDGLEWELEASSLVGHYGMPIVATQASERRDLVAYIFSLQPRVQARPVLR
jgi:cytochrome c